jgi:trehalose/maltose hydrolase-like predicted phosphorylase
MSADVLRFDPHWPTGLGTMRMALRYRDHRLTVELTAQELRVRSDAGPGRPIKIHCHGSAKSVAAGQSVTWAAV